jgi:sugar phosphate isomerase/epimerase
MSSDANNKLGMVIARAENLPRLEYFDLGRAEFVVFAPEQKQELDAFIAARKPSFSVHNPLYVPPDYPENPLLACIIDSDEDRRRLAVGLMLDSIRIAADMGAEFVVVHIQRPEQFAGVAPGCTALKAMDSALRSAEALAEKSAELDMPVLVENLMDNACFYLPEHYLALLEKFPSLNFCLDIGHLDLDARRFGFEFYDFVRALAPRTREIHLQNSSGAAMGDGKRLWKTPVHPTQTEAEGWRDVGAVLRDVLAARPDCIVNFEFRPQKYHDENFIREGIEWVRGIVDGAWAR